MRNPSEKEDVQREQVLERCFECLSKNGIEKTSIRDLSKATGMTTSSLYYWFKDKDEIVLDATEYGIRVIVDRLFEAVIENLDSVENMCMELYKLVKNYQLSMKTIFQVVASPKYGQKVAEMSEHTTILYDTCAKRLAGHLKTSYEKVRIIVDLFISSIIDCVLWGEWDKLSREMEFLLSILLENDE